MMKNVILILLLLLCSTTYAQKTTAQSELDLRLELQQKEIDSKLQALQVRSEIADAKEKQIDEKIELQNAQIHNAILTGSIILAIMAVAAILIGYMAGRNSNQKIQVIKTAVGNFAKTTDKDIKEFKETTKERIDIIKENTKNEISYLKEETKNQIKEIKEHSALQIRNARLEIEQVKKEAETSLAQIKKSEQKTKAFADKLDALMSIFDVRKEELIATIQQMNTQDRISELKEIKDLINLTQKAKSETEYTAADWFMTGYYASIQSLPDEASKCYEKSASIDPQNAATYNFWGSALAEQAEALSNRNMYTDSCEKFKKATELKPDYTNAYYNWANALLGLGKIMNNEELYDESCEKYKKVIELDANNGEAYLKWGNVLFEQGLLREDEYLIKDGCLKYETATQLQPDNAEIYKNWGSALAYLGEILEDAQLLADSCQKYEKASTLVADDALIYYNWGVALYLLGKLTGNDRFSNCYNMYRIATTIDPSYAEAYNNWAQVLSEMAKQKNDRKLYEESCDKAKIAAEQDPKNPTYFNNWGIALFDLASIDNDEHLFEESCDKYKRATKLDPTYAEAFNNWGTTLFEVAKIKNSLATDSTVIEDKFLRAEELNEGEAAYNLACLYALLGRSDEALQWLDKALATAYISKEHLESDSDIDSIRNEVAFIELMGKY